MVGLLRKSVIPGSHCVFYFKDLKEKCTAPAVALSSGKRFSSSWLVAESVCGAVYGQQMRR